MSVNAVSSQGNVKNIPQSSRFGNIIIEQGCHIVNESFHSLEEPEVSLGHLGRDLVVKAFQPALEEMHAPDGRKTGEVSAWETKTLN